MGCVYFQPPYISGDYCEVGYLVPTDKDYIYYLHDSCKILISEVRIIDEKDVFLNKKTNTYRLINPNLGQDEKNTICISDTNLLPQ
jgi:hypothetical protein